MGVPADDKDGKKTATDDAQARRDDAYFEKGITAKHELLGAQYKPKEGAELSEHEAARREKGAEVD